MALYCYYVVALYIDTQPKESSMFDTAWTFLCRVAWNGIVAFIYSIIPCIVISFVFMIAMIPVGFLNDGLANGMSSIVDSILFRVVYFCIFADLMFEDYGMPGVEYHLKRWWRKVRS